MIKRSLSFIISLLILVIIYWKIDFVSLSQVFHKSDRLWMLISLSMVIPLTMLTAWRLQQLTPSPSQIKDLNTLESPIFPVTNLSFAEANRLILAASVLNLILPSKMGDIAKAYFMKKRGHLSGSLALSLVVFEKVCDLLSLLLWCVFGLILYPYKDWLFGLMTLAVTGGLIMGLMLLGWPKFANIFFNSIKAILPKKKRPQIEKLQIAWGEMHDYFWYDKLKLVQITFISIFLWFCHLLQIWFFILALKAWVPFLANLALSPLAILAGLLPLTFAGVGTRDAALILFYQPYFDAATAAALGLLCTSRYILPAVGGLPFLNRYMIDAKNLEELR